MLTVSQAAQRLGVDPQTVRNRIHAGDFPATRTSKGKRSWFRIKEADLDAYERELEVTAA